MNKIGVITDSFRLGLQEGIIKAKDVGAEGINYMLYVVRCSREFIASSPKRIIRFYQVQWVRSVRSLW